MSSRSDNNVDIYLYLLECEENDKHGSLWVDAQSVLSLVLRQETAQTRDALVASFLPSLVISPQIRQRELRTSGTEYSIFIRMTEVGKLTSSLVVFLLQESTEPVNLTFLPYRDFEKYYDKGQFWHISETLRRFAVEMLSFQHQHLPNESPGLVRVHMLCDPIGPGPCIPPASTPSSTTKSPEQYADEAPIVNQAPVPSQTPSHDLSHYHHGHSHPHEPPSIIEQYNFDEAVYKHHQHHHHHHPHPHEHHFQLADSIEFSGGPLFEFEDSSTWQQLFGSDVTTLDPDIADDTLFAQSSLLAIPAPEPVYQPQQQQQPDEETSHLISPYTPQSSQAYVNNSNTHFRNHAHNHGHNHNHNHSHNHNHDQGLSRRAHDHAHDHHNHHHHHQRTSSRIQQQSTQSSSQPTTTPQPPPPSRTPPPHQPLIDAVMEEYQPSSTSVINSPVWDCHHVGCVWHDGKAFIPLYISLAYIIGLNSTPSDTRRWLSRARPDLQPRNDESLNSRVPGMLPRTRYIRYEYIERVSIGDQLDTFLPKDRTGQQMERQDRLSTLKATLFGAR